MPRRPWGRTPRIGLLALLAVGPALPVTGCGASLDRQPPGRAAAVTAEIKGLDNPFFVTMRQGLVDTARRRHVRLRVEAAASLDDTVGQASSLEALVAQGAGCYIVNPIDGTNLIQPLMHVPPGVPIVNIDSPVDRSAARAAGVRIATYIGTDNVAAGRLAAAAMARRIPGGARVHVIKGIPGDATSEARARGFLDGARGRFTVVDAVPADFDRGEAAAAAGHLLRSDRRLAGIFAVNDEMALGVANATRTARRRHVAVIGLDGIPEALRAIRRGALTATVAQYPYTIGQLAVEACAAQLRGARVPARIDAPVRLIDARNVARALARFPRPVPAASQR
jgi:ABC-type sugar transport system substrate-binding protein